MILTQRERQIAFGLAALIGVAALFFGIIKPNIDGRTAVAADINSAMLERQQNETVYAEKAKLLKIYNKMVADGLENSEADAREQIRDALDKWSQGCRVSVNTLSDAAVTHNGDFDQINFKLNGAGSSKNIAMLLNQCETTSLPLRVTKFVPIPVKEGQDYLKFDLTVSTLCIREDASNAARARPPGQSKTFSEVDAARMVPGSVTPTILHALADPYKILNERSIFARDNRATPDASPRLGWHKDLTTQPSTAPATDEAPEADYVLRGVGIEDGVVTAFFEQTSEGKGVSRHIGQAIARGEITSMSLDGIEYLANGKTTQIGIGQALDGRMAAATESTISSTPTSGGGTDKPSWWGHRLHGDSPAPAAPATDTPGAPATTHGSDDRHSHDGRRSGDDHRQPESGDDSNRKPGDDPSRKPDDAGPPPSPDDGPDPVIIIAPN